MLREFTGRDEDLRDADVVVRNHDNLEQVSDFRVIVDGRCNVCDQFHNSLGLPISRKSFPSEHDHSGYILGSPFLGSHLFHLLVPVDDTHDVEQLSLVLMDALHLMVQRIGE